MSRDNIGSYLTFFIVKYGEGIILHTVDIGSVQVLQNHIYGVKGPYKRGKNDLFLAFQVSNMTLVGEKLNN